jgi:hypothetical protein
MSGLKFLYNLILKDTVKGSGSASGILSIGSDVRKIAMNKYAKYVNTAKKQGVDLDKLSEQEIKYMIELNKPKAPKVFSNEEAYKFLNQFLSQGKKGKVIRGKFKPLVTVDSVITDREKIAGDESVTDHIFERNIIDETEDFAYGGIAGMLGERTGYNEGKKVGRPKGQVWTTGKGGGEDVVDPSFDELDSETWLKIIKAAIAGDYGPIEYAGGGRVPFSMGRRAFLKLLGGVGAGIGALKTGAFKLLGKEAAPVAEEVVKSVGSGTKPPPYFFNLVNKIKNLGDDVTPKYATQERQRVTRYKDYELTEDVATGEKTIQRVKMSNDSPQYYDETLAEETYMNYKPGKSQMDKTTKGKTPPDEYTEDTSYLRTSGPSKGEIYDTVDGVADDVIQEGTMFEDNITEFGKKITKTKKASGGLAYMVGE